MICAGIDIGSTTSKAVILRDGIVLARTIEVNRSLPAESARASFSRCIELAGVNESDINAVATSGYGRRLANFGDLIITEIKACAMGAGFSPCPDGRVRTIVDVGGQDTKVISLGENGEVEDFAMNDKCAAGTGRFLEMLAAKLGMTYEEFIEASFRSTVPVHMNSTCAVFAESEVVSLLARGISREDIASAAHDSIAGRIAAMIRRCGAQEIVEFSGGGARNRALVKAVEENLNRKIYIPEHPQTLVALGAALAAAEKIMKENSK